MKDTPIQVKSRKLLDSISEHEETARGEKLVTLLHLKEVKITSPNSRRSESFEAVRLDHPRVPGSHYYRAKVQATGVTFDQTYPTRPDMWRRLEQDAKACGPRFATDTLAAK